MEMSESFTNSPSSSSLGGSHFGSAGAPNPTHKIADAAGPTVDRVAFNAHEAVDKMADAVTRAAETLDVKGGQLKDLQVQWLEKSSAYIRDNPLKTIGIAVVGGFLLSRLVSSR